MATATSTATRPEVLDSLNVDLSKEHGAIIQYVLHGVQARGTGVMESVMAAAREEMWHFEWLVEAIKKRGGTPTLDRADLFLDTSLSRSIDADRNAEDDALAHYEVTLTTIGDADEELTTLINRIMDDERHHRVTFVDLREWIASTGEASFAPPPGLVAPDVPWAGQLVGLEYNGLLRYLWNKYGIEAGESTELYFELAINEMRHLKWVGTCFGGMPVAPSPPPVPRVESVSTPAEAREAALKYESVAQAAIGSVGAKLAGDIIRGEAQRIDYQHAYHRYQLAHTEEA